MSVIFMWTHSVCRRSMCLQPQPSAPLLPFHLPSTTHCFFFPFPYPLSSLLYSQKDSLVEYLCGPRVLKEASIFKTHKYWIFFFLFTLFFFSQFQQLLLYLTNFLGVEERKETDCVHFCYFQKRKDFRELLRTFNLIGGRRIGFFLSEEAEELGRGRRKENITLE